MAGVFQYQSIQGSVEFQSGYVSVVRMVNTHTQPFLLGARRLVMNLEHFQTNYYVVIVILSIYCM